MAIKLKQISSDVWYVTGDGKPRPATPLEIELWQAAQGEIVAAIGEPRTTWNKVMDFAKWGALVITVVTFLVLLSDWMVLQSFYGTLNLPALTYRAFTEGPLHLQGITQFLVAYFAILFVSLIVVVLYHGTIRIGIRSADKKMRVLSLIQGAVFISLVILFVVSLFYFDKSFSRNLTIAGAIIAVTILLWLYFNDLFLNHLPRLKQALQVVIVAFAVFFVFPAAFLTAPSFYGKELAADILEGKEQLPDVAMITDRIFLMSNQVDTFPLPGGEWLYAPKYISPSGGSDLVPSLQYIGTADEDMYVLDIAASMAYAIPKSAVKELIFAFSETELFDSADIPNYWLTPAVLSPTLTPTAPPPAVPQP